MSIFTKFIDNIIIGRLKNLMKDIIQPILDLIKGLVQPEQGSKFLVSLAGIGAIAYLNKIGVASVTSDVSIGAIIVIYSVARIFEKKGSSNAKATTVSGSGTAPNASDN